MNGGDVVSLYEEDGFSAAKLFSQGYSYTYDDVIFLPHYIDFPTDAVSLTTKLTKNISLSIPCVSSPMDTVTESSMAAAMASLGGIGIIHSNNTPSQQASLLRAAKSHRFPFTSDLVFLSPFDSVTSADQFGSSPCIFVTESGSPQSKLFGLVSLSTWESLTPDDRESRRVSDYMMRIPGGPIKTLPNGSSLEDIASFLAAENLEFAPLVAEDGEEIVNVVSASRANSILNEFPKMQGVVPSVGPDGKFLVGASIGTRESDKERLAELVKGGVNVVVVDSSQGNSIYQLDMIKHAKRTYPGVDIIGGNVVTMAQARNLIQAGVDGLRVGMGSGSICTTQEVCAVGRGQNGVRVKKYRGMGSLEAMTKGSDARYLGDTSKLKIAQGVVGAVADKGSVLKFVPYTMQALKQGFQDLGASSLHSAHELLRSGVLRLEVRTGAAQVEGGVHGLVSYEKKPY
ncbi:OLC1v1022203C1 [Oldenlandia corymbosa var. corymbosa]|uniref:OLC1v1022203C1 n=1 Tax=Oldenlandia corymbosa var. corymbosa TaxID=529605 RepID=A0AAV1BZY3_OLDCO|nr:OLC1v1022203C1 [Oldenlandia corymbosa var. corymbosa]